MCESYSLTVCACVAVVTVLLTSGVQAGVVRRYYVAAQEVDWHYTAGYQVNLLNVKDTGTPNHFLKQDQDRIGAKYKKAVYKQYTDATFSHEISKPPSSGLVGPVLRAEVGDAFEIVYFNNASREYSMHPHGVFYLKEHEAAIYVDGTSGRLKSDDIVMPGERVTLIWNVTDNDAPGRDDPNCIPWVYHSHINAVRDTSAGMMGVLVTCRPGTLDSSNQRTDVDVDYPLLIKIFDENLSWYIDENAQRCLDPDTCAQLIDDGDEDFTESNYMASINGYMYGHLPGLTACVGKRVAFYMIGMGNEFDIHSIHFHGQNMHYKHTRGDTVSVYSATFVAAEMTPQVAGYWLVADMVGDNKKNGMGAYLFTRDCTSTRFRLRNMLFANTRSSATVKEYFLSADKVTWNYGPLGVDTRTGLPLTADGTNSQQFFQQGSGKIGGTYVKAAFVQYSDASYTSKQNRSADMQHLGMLGPVLRAEAGDTLKVTVRNNVSFPISLLPHGLQYSPTEEVTGDIGVPVGGKLCPGQFHTYVFQVPDDLFNETSEPCLNFLYTSAYDQEMDINTGLVGPLVVCRKGYSAEPGPKPKEKFLLFQSFDENKSHYLSENVNMVPGVDTDSPGFDESNTMFSINGYSFGNIPGVSVCLGDEVTWYVMGLGETFDVHTAHFDGNTFTEMGRHRDTKPLVPGSTGALSMLIDNPGYWAFESHSNLAKVNGMFGFYNAEVCNNSLPTPAPFSPTGKTRRVYVAAEEVDWDYAPVERSIITGADLNDPREEANIFIVDDEEFIGGVYRKAVYREYTDQSFTARKVTPGDEHLDILGPAIRAEVGDVIEVVFRNNASRSYSMHANGVKYTAGNSGVNYLPNQAVAPGQTVTYRWEVPARSGPGPADPNCIPWMYSSAVDPERDTLSGLMGMLVVCRPGTLDDAGMRKDVDKEFFLLMSVMNENLSWYLPYNVAKYAPNRVGTDYGSDGDFEESNKMHAINGRLHGNTHHLAMDLNDTVAWYFAAMGSEVDLHSFHMHGHTAVHTSEGHRDDAFNIFPGQAEALEMIADNPGTWLLHCHMLDHIIAGMETVYTVRKPAPVSSTPVPTINIPVG